MKDSPIIKYIIIIYNKEVMSNICINLSADIDNNNCFENIKLAGGCKVKVNCTEFVPQIVYFNTSEDKEDLCGISFNCKKGILNMSCEYLMNDETSKIDIESSLNICNTSNFPLKVGCRYESTHTLEPDCDEFSECNVWAFGDVKCKVNCDDYIGCRLDTILSGSSVTIIDDEIINREHNGITCTTSIGCVLDCNELVLKYKYGKLDKIDEHGQNTPLNIKNLMCSYC
jgi:hypothetical protein